MSDRGLYVGIAVVAAAAGTAFWLLGRPSGTPQPTEPTIGAAALYAATFEDTAGRAQPLGQYQGRLLLLNFWATWCAPCREEMPALSAAARRWQGRGVAIVGLSSEPPGTVREFAHTHPADYPLGTGGAVDELRRRLGDTPEVLPYSALVAADGRVVAQRVGPYSPAELDALFEQYAPKSAEHPGTPG